VVVKEQAGNAHQAIEGALRKLKRAVGATLAKHDPRQQRAKPDVASAMADAAAAEIDSPVPAANA